MYQLQLRFWQIFWKMAAHLPKSYYRLIHQRVHCAGSRPAITEVIDENGQSYYVAGVRRYCILPRWHRSVWCASNINAVGEEKLSVFYANKQWKDD